MLNMYQKRNNITLATIRCRLGVYDEDSVPPGTRLSHQNVPKVFI